MQINVKTLSQKYGLVIVFLMLCLGLSLLSDRFLTLSNAINILRQSTINGIIAIGMTYVILTAGIDLSGGSILALTGVVTASLLQREGISVPIAVVVGLTMGAFLGLINGAIITQFKVPPFVTTLGMMTIARGLALTFTEGRPITGLPDGFRAIKKRTKRVSPSSPSTGAHRVAMWSATLPPITLPVGLWPPNFCAMPLVAVDKSSNLKALPEPLPRVTAGKGSTII